MSIKQVELDNMFGIDSKKYIGVQYDEDYHCSSYYIINKIINAYNNIYEYFDNTKDIDSLKKAESNIVAYMESTSIFQLKNTSGQISSAYDCDKNSIESIITGNNEMDRNIVGLLPFLLSFFSIFEYNQFSSVPLSNEEGFEVGGKELIYEEFNTGSETGYKFFSSNRFFNIMDIFISQSWGDSPAKYGKKEIGSVRQLLVKGYYNDGNEDHAVFETEDDIKRFIYECVYNTKTIIGNNNFTLKIANDYSMTSSLILNIKATLDEKITGIEQEKLGKSDKEYKIGNSKIAVRSASDDVTCYKNIFEYSIKLLKSYVEALKKSDPSITTQKLYKDSYVIKLIDKIVGAKQDSSGIAFNKNTSFGIFDAENKGKEYIDYISNKLGILSSVPLQANPYGYKKETLNDLTKEKTKTLGSYIETTKAVNNSVFFKNFENKLKGSSGINASSIDKSIYFYETVIYGDGNDNYYSSKAELNSSLSNYAEKINEFCQMSGCVISKFIFLSLYDLSENSKVKYNNESSLECTSFNLTKKYTYADKILLIDDEYYSDYSKAYSALGKSVVKYINDIIKLSGNSAEAEQKKQEVLNQASSFRSYVKSRIGSEYHTEKDYFYINDGINGKKIPSNPFVDIEFRVPRYSNDGKVIEAIEWLPVTSIRVGDTTEDNKIVVNDSSAESYREMYAGTYFDSFELVDNGGVKEISLTLKSSNDINLEKIIFNSLSLDDKLRTLASDSGNIASYIDTMLKDTESNFRIRFGYRDVAANDASNNETTITSSNNSSKEFLERTKNVKPVLVYPWTYFKITGLDSNIKDGEDTYSIKAVSSGDYILSHMSLCGISTNFSKEAQDDNFRGTPLNVIGKIAKWITLASCDNNEGGKEKDITTARICFLGDEQGTIITDFNNIENSFDDTYKFELKGEQSIKGGNIKTIEKSFFNSSNNQVLTAKNFNITNDVRVPSIKEVLDNLVKWLPSRVYYIAKLEKTNQTVALYIPYETIYTIDDFFTNPAYPHKSEEMTYQIIEADAHIYKGEKNFTKEDREDKNFYHKVYFIRMYYEGPGISTTEKGEVPNEYLRIYNYRSLQEQVIENVEISSTNDSEFGNTIASVMMLGSGTPIAIAYNRNTGKQYENATSVLNSDTINTKDVSGFKDLGQFSSWFSPKANNAIIPKLVYNNSQYILSDVKGTSNFDAISSMYVEEASNFFTAMQNKQYEGELTIIGDPFYYFDSSLEAGKYEIYLQMNRVKDMKSYELVESKYSGIYFIKGIKHNMDQNGKYTTTLSIVKRVFGSDDGNINKS